MTGPDFSQHSPWTYPPDIFPRTVPPWTIYAPFLHGVWHSPFHHHNPTTYNITIPLTCTRLIEVDRLGSRVRVSDSFHIFALTAGGVSSVVKEDVRENVLQTVVWMTSVNKLSLNVMHDRINSFRSIHVHCSGPPRRYPVAWISLPGYSR